MNKRKRKGELISHILTNEVIDLTDKKGLYIHIPFCQRKCNYCDFTSFEDKLSLTEQYFEKLADEMKKHPKYPIDTVYFGGGTPSAVKSLYICNFLYKAYSYFDIDKDAEITIEVNPISAIEDKLHDYKRAGINRISMGAQSFNDNELKILGRLHSREEIYSTYETIRKCGFDNVSLDLMFGLPNQTEDKLLYSVDEILRLSPEHISCYGLKIEEGTPFYRQALSGEITPIDDDTFAEMYELVCQSIVNGGYTQAKCQSTIVNTGCAKNI